MQDNNTDQGPINDRYPENAPFTIIPSIKQSSGSYQVMRKKENNTEGGKAEDPSKYKQNLTYKKKISKGKKIVVDRFVGQYDKLMTNIIRKNNDDIYTKLKEFLQPGYGGINQRNPFDEDTKGLTIQGVGGVGFGINGLPQSSDSQVPTCLVITSNESVSSIDTQFSAMCQELKQQIGSINLVLDDKKCTSMKYTIEHIQSRLRDQLGLSNQYADDLVRDGYQGNVEEDESGDEVMLHIDQNDSSEEEREPEVNPHNNGTSFSTMHVSSLMQSSFQLNDTLRQSNSPVPDETIDLNQTEENATEKTKTKKEKVPSNIKTRGQKIQDQKSGRFSSIAQNMEIQDAYDENLSKMMNDQQMQSDIFQKETFYGLKHLLSDVDTQKRPVLLIIQNIKTFPPGVLNDLIHHLKIYRGHPHFLNFNLMLGVQSNNREEIHLRVTIQNCVKLVMKTFYFPSMKNIIFEVVYKMLMSKDSLLTFEPQVIQSIIQTINMFGMSVEKFKRIIKVLIAEHVYQNQDYFFAHNIPIGLLSKKEYTQVHNKLQNELVLGYEEYHNEMSATLKQEIIESLLTNIQNYIKKRRHWFKAFEVIQELVCRSYLSIEKEIYKKNLEKQILVREKLGSNSQITLKNDHETKKQEEEILEAVEQFTVPENELKIFRYQFILNYMSKPSTNEKINFVMSCYSLTPDWNDTIQNELLPVLQEKQFKKVIVDENGQQINQARESAFIKAEHKIVLQMLKGKYQFLKMQKEDERMQKLGAGSKSITYKSSVSRQEALLGGGSKHQIDQQQKMVDVNLKELGIDDDSDDDDRTKEAYGNLRPKDDLGYKKMFWNWMEDFHVKYLGCEKSKSSKFQRQLFHVSKNDFDDKINPDLAGNMTKSIIDSYAILKKASQSDEESQLLKQLQTQENNLSQSQAPQITKPTLRGDEAMKGEIGVEHIDSNEENTKILYELMKFYGRDVNVLEMYGLFKTILKKASNLGDDIEQIQYTERDTKTMFINSLFELKYMGYISQTKQSTFVFKKNFFGKTKQAKGDQRTEEQKQQQSRDIQRQYGAPQGTN